VSPQALADALTRWLPGDDAARPGSASAEPAAAAPAAAEPAPVRDPENAVFDRSGMLARVMDDEDLARSVAVSFLADMPRQIEALRSYLDASDGEGTIRQAHTIKGASANVCGESLRAVAFEMEKAAAAGDFAYVVAHLPDLDGQFASLREVMQAYVDENRPGPSGPS
jgi:HPt (histidine-containing phosphotransfer) domain-containing protein